MKPNSRHSHRNVLLGAAAMAALATAAQAQSSAGPEVSEVVVTGSYIRGTPEDASLPVDVIGAEEISKRGNPSTLELIKTLTVSSGVLGDTNQFDSRAQGTGGTGSINLRGLGPERTLVLLNGRRMAANPAVNTAGGAVDTNLIPSAAIGRVEILKDGAAATYGSDAIGGVVNFITRTNLNGLEASADYRFIDGSNGDYTGAVAWGGAIGGIDLFLSAGYQHRSPLRVLDRDFANPEYLENPQGGYTSVGNPGTYIPLGATFTAVGPAQRDVNCASLGGFAGFSGATPVCYSRSTQFDNIIDKEDRYQVFGSAKYDITEKVQAHFEGLYAHTKINQVTTPSQVPAQTPTIEAAAAPSLAGRLFVPVTNPGVASYLAANPGIFPAGISGIQLAAYRPFFLGGNPLFGGTGGAPSINEIEAFRLSGGLKGEFANGVRFDLAVTYMEDKVATTNSDTLVNRLQLALRGLGGPNCDTAPSTPGIQGTAGVGGCQYFNPFSTAVARNSATGAVNPQFNPSATNSAELVRWFYSPSLRERTSALFVVDAVLDGKLSFSLPGGEIGWAAGVQLRKDRYENNPDSFVDQTAFPCIATPDFGVTNCVAQTGPLGLVAPSSPIEVKGDAYAVFAELQLPITDSIQAQVAARYEDYGGSVGSTFDPKVSVRWQATEWLAFRGSVGTTFRGPPTTATQPVAATTLQGIRGVFKPVDTFGSPDLKPESATTYSAGLLVKTGGLRGSLDYWAFHFDNPLTSEPISALVSALYPSNTVNRCADPAYAAVLARFTFNDLNGNGTADDCAAANIARMKTFIINGSPVKTDGFDLSASYLWENVLGGELTLGGDATYVHKYQVDPLNVAGLPLATGFDAVGRLNFQTVTFPLPKYRGSAYLEYKRGAHNLRWTVNYIDGYTDERTDIYLPSVNNATNGVAVALPQGKQIGSWTIHNLAYRVTLPWDTTVNVAIDNVFDKDPPFVRLNLSYDPFVANGYGRTIKVGVKKRF